MSDRTAPLPSERDGLRGRLIFLVCLILITLGRVYLLRNEDIITNNSAYDDHLFVQLGEHAFWWRPPDETSLVRLPVYPLWIWLCHQTGVPLYLGTNVLAIATSLLLVFALRKLNLPRFACVAVYAALLFEINAIDSMRRAVASGFYGILLVATLAWMALALASKNRRQLWVASGGLAVSLGLFAITRAESILAWIVFISFVAAFALREMMAAGRRHVSIRALVAAGLLPALALIAAPLVVATVNKNVFGVFTSCSLTSRAFSAAINHLLAIQPDKDIAYVPVTRDARKKAYAVSPAFARLKRYLEGPRGARWGRHAASLYKVAPQEVGGGWFFFALRRAIIAETEARTPVENEAYYQRIADELEQGFNEGKLPKRRVWVSLIQPDPTIWGRIPAALGRIFIRVLNPPPPANILDVLRPPDSFPAIEETFDRVTYRRLRVESVTDTHPNRLDFDRAAQQMSAVGKFYSFTFKILLVALFPSLILLGIFRNSPAHNSRLYLWLIPLIGFLAARVTLLAVIDASSFNTTVTQYLNTIAGPLAIAAIVVNTQAIVMVFARLRTSPT